MKIAEAGYWLNETGEGHVFDRPLSQEIIAFMKENYLNSVLDLGCGEGSYLRAFTEAGIRCIGLDGNPHTEELTGGLGCKVELHKPIRYAVSKLDSRLISEFDLVLSLEVGEHIPEEYEQIFLDNVVKPASAWIILSWAIPGQGGAGHVNCKSNADIIREMGNRKYICNWVNTLRFRKAAELPWFKNTLMVFQKCRIF